MSGYGYVLVVFLAVGVHYMEAPHKLRNKGSPLHYHTHPSTLDSSVYVGIRGGKLHQSENENESGWWWED